ncbi:hypothetical protein NQ317_009298 [Molorchus minor]|uniref:Carboxylesterase type B domain-containing protein n=1 Tax=Molorchus minor TaxID=1323400 RepID=A0ABQ9JD47_9CUCU|nr:hypothetical protein NQ317_009298 [Molorchus minor]
MEPIKKNVLRSDKLPLRRPDDTPRTLTYANSTGELHREEIRALKWNNILTFIRRSRRFQEEVKVYPVSIENEEQLWNRIQNAVQELQSEETLRRVHFNFLRFLRTQGGGASNKEESSGGNLGIKDIAAALRWIKINIAAFGGDPARITLMGHDTGAALVNLLFVSPTSKGI